MNPHEHDKLEAPVHRMLRSLPDRKAPAGMESRILAEISRRAALPWWRKSFAHWPAVVRAGFFVISAVAAALVVFGLFVVSGTAGAHEVAGGLSHSYSWLVIGRDVVAAASARVGMFLASVPTVWLYGIAGAVGLSYAAVAAAGAATYRALSIGRQTT
jgi:hypothetical protein